jgi:hypothetical protein
MVYLPLAMTGYYGTEFKLLGLVATWSFLPLIPPSDGGFETIAKHGLLLGQILVYHLYGSTSKSFVLKWLYRLVLLCVILTQIL